MLAPGLLALGLLSGLPALAAPAVSCGMPEHHPRALGPSAANLRARSGLAPLPGAPHFFGGGCTRPSYSEFDDSASYPIRVHYDPQYASTAADVLGWMETSWDLETRTITAGGLEFPPPEVDGTLGGGTDCLDVYLEPSGYGGYYCPEEYVFGSDYIGTSGFISINPDTSASFMSAAVAHELHHAIQFGIDAHEDTSFMEMTSAYVMEVVFDQADAASGFISEFQAFPHYSLDYFDYGEPYQYGASLWLFWFSDDLFGSNGHAALRYVWLASSQYWDGSTDPGAGNEPDYFDAMNELLVAPGNDMTLEEAYREFAADRWFTGDAHDGTFDEGDSFPGPDLARTLDKGDSGDELTLSDDTAEFGASYVRIRLDDPSPEATLMLEWDLAAAKQWAVLVIRPEAAGDRETIATSDSGSELLTALDGESEVIVVFVNTGDGDHDPDADDWGGSEVSFSFVYDDPNAPAADGADDPFACGCTLVGSSQPSSVWAPLALAAFAIVLRRRRT